MEKVLALALEAGCAVGHDTLSLCSANLAAEVGLAGFAELALAAFRCAGECVSRVSSVSYTHLTLPTKRIV